MSKNVKKLSQGEGTVFYDENIKKYRIQFYYFDSTGKQHRKSFSGKRVTELIIKKNEFLENLRFIEAQERGKKVTPVNILTNEAESDYKKNLIRSSSYRRRLDTISIIKRHEIGYTPIFDIDDDMLDDFFIYLTKYSNSTIGKVYGALNRAYDYAVENNQVIENPLKRKSIKRPVSKMDNKKISAFTIEDQKLFLEELMHKKKPSHGCDYRYQLIIELMSGMRMGEINALTVEDVDLKNNVIHVHKTISRNSNNKRVIENPKTINGNRDVPISKQLKPFLERALKETSQNKYNVLFYDYENDSLISTQQVNCSFKRFCKKIGLISGTNQHMLRHTFATRCIEAGVPAAVLKNWLGHSSIEVTIDTYCDVFDNFQKESIDQFNRYIDEKVAFV